MENKIVIGAGKKNKDKKEIEHDLHKTDIVLHDNDIISLPPVSVEQETVQIPLDENVWGNDYTIVNKLDEEQLATRRLFVRVRYLQTVECIATYESKDSDPVLLKRPIIFNIIDISLGGIGVVCESALDIGAILSVNFKFDDIPYEVKCEIVYSIPSDDKFRVGLKIVQKKRQFMKHLKIIVARISLTGNYRPIVTDYFENKKKRANN